MATFKNIAYQNTETIDAKSSGHQLVLNVGDVISYVVSTQIAAKITNKSGAEAALAAGNNLYIIAQSDDITDGNGTAYKCYKLNDTVTLETGATRKVVGYVVNDIANIVGLE